MPEILKKYYIKHALILAILWIIFVIFLIIIYSSNNIIFLHFGPTNDSKFIIYEINTWTKWTLLMIYSFLSQFIHSILNSTLHSFIVNVVRDHKTIYNGTIKYPLLITIVYKIYYWIHYICNIFLILTYQLQFYIPALIADIMVGIFITKKYLYYKININENTNYIL